jgi:hypothetical protein
MKDVIIGKVKTQMAVIVSKRKEKRKDHLLIGTR